MDANRTEAEENLLDRINFRIKMNSSRGKQLSCRRVPLPFKIEAVTDMPNYGGDVDEKKKRAEELLKSGPG